VCRSPHMLARVVGNMKSTMGPGLGFRECTLGYLAEIHFICFIRVFMKWIIQKKKLVD
jgi:hypothetical protein